MFTLVTACMNREQHLRKTLHSWLKLPQIAEVVIVDWSNNRPLDSLRAVDERVKIVRVEGEPRWILSYAYNVGVVHATQPLILKCDADCIPRPEVVACIPEASCFYAGNWRSGRPVGKPSVNGQTIFLKSHFEAVNGYSEVIRTYGRDDEDFYDRLIAAGFERREIAPDLLDFLDHSDAERTANQFDADSRLPIEKRIVRDLLYCEMRNYYLAQRMPWGASQRRATFQEIGADDRLTVLRRDRASEIVIPGEIEREAHLFALRFVTTQLAGISLEAAESLDERACLILIASRSKPVAHLVGAKRVVAASPSGSPRANGVRGRTANALAPSAASTAVARVRTQPLSSAAQ
ncbi:MAG TPA: glycosyltransferase family 2 protein, partial [Opitutus sp.]|nr:glycosyltransferase family 2 protein [Opitutus sp.]